MKRSEAEEYIQGIIREHATYSKIDGVLLNVSELSELIVDKLDDLGIKPESIWSDGHCYECGGWPANSGWEE